MESEGRHTRDLPYRSVKSFQPDRGHRRLHNLQRVGRGCGASDGYKGGRGGESHARLRGQSRRPVSPLQGRQELCFNFFARASRS